MPVSMIQFIKTIREQFPGMSLITAKRFADRHYVELCELAEKDRREVAERVARVQLIQDMDSSLTRYREGNSSLAEFLHEVRTSLDKLEPF